jgi:hypothetical protein
MHEQSWRTFGSCLYDSVPVAVMYALESRSWDRGTQCLYQDAAICIPFGSGSSGDRRPCSGDSLSQSTKILMRILIEECQYVIVINVMAKSDRLLR